MGDVGMCHVILPIECHLMPGEAELHGLTADLVPPVCQPGHECLLLRIREELLERYRLASIAVHLALVVPILWIGVHPDPLLRRIEPSVSVLLQDMELRRLRAAETAARAADSVSHLDGPPGRAKREKPGAEALTDRWERVGRTPG